MTQTSRPTAQHTDNYPNGDSGPYSSLQWRTVFKTMFTTDDDQGPIAGYLNGLAVTNPIGKTIRVASGGAVVGGNIFFNDANVDFSPPNPAGAARYDYVVACLNDTNAVMTVSDAGRTLAFPTDLTDYNSASSIQEYASRLVIVRGAEGGGLPTLDQNDDHYMIPLASYLISTAGAVSSLTDRRDFCSVPVSQPIMTAPLAGYNLTDGTDVAVTISANLNCGVLCANNKITYVGGEPFYITEIYANGFSLKTVVLSEWAFSGNIVCHTYAPRHTCSSAWILPTPSQSAIPTIGAHGFTCVAEVEETSFSVGDICHPAFVRTGTSGSDTLFDDIRVVGFLITPL